MALVHGLYLHVIYTYKLIIYEIFFFIKNFQASTHSTIK